MEEWAHAYTDDIQFLCVCVESLPVAKMFDRMFRFQKATNAYIPSRGYLPVGYGQLGCSGFIISDKDGNFVSRKTKAFLQYGEEAFRHVEAILKQLTRTSTESVSSSSQKKQLPSTATKGDSSTNHNYLPPSLGIASMDHEHESCALAIQALVTQPTEKNLRKVIYELELHFAHEEALMVEHGFGGDGGPFSALTSHTKDHERILDIGRNVLCQGSSMCSLQTPAASS